MSELPERIGHYRIESTLGRGGMGEVFLAWDERLRRRVALKRLRADVADSPASRERFRREASTAAELSHPSAVHVYDLVEETDGDYLVMEYVPGDSLRHRLARGPLSVIETLRFGRQIAEGLAAAHGAGLIHRDLKADNVILTEKGEAKILDFGLARHVCPLPDETSLTQRGFVVGTYHAMSPEQATGAPVDERSDLFSLGSLLAEMLTGKPPFKADTPAATLRRVLAETPPPLATLRSDVPEALSSLISRLLAKDPADRPASAEQVARALREIAMDFQGDSAALAPTISELPTSWDHPGMAKQKPRSRRRWWIYGAAGVVGLAGISVGVWSMVHTEPQADADDKSGGIVAPSAPLRVLVRPPKTEPDDDRALHLPAACALSEALNELSLLEGVEALHPSSLNAETLEKGNSRTMAEEAAADEVVFITISRGETEHANLDVRRLLSNGATKTGAPQSRRVSLDEGDLPSFGYAVREQIRQAYRERRAVSKSTEIAVRAEDYSEFVKVKARVDAGEASDLRGELRILERVITGSPDFWEAHLLAASLDSSLYQSYPEESDLQAAHHHLTAARKLAANEPRVLEAEFKLALVEGKLSEAKSLLEQLMALRPSYTSLLGLQASLAEADGRIEDALQHRREEVEEAPSWRAFYNLAVLAMRSGRVGEARQTLDRTISRWPDNVWPRREKYEVELLYGDLHEAELIARDLLKLEASPGHYTDLGLALFLQEDFEGAFDAYEKALKSDQNNAQTLLNLADVEFQLGRSEEARRHCQRVVARLEKKDLAPTDQFTRAQCLARLGEHDEALDFANTAWRSSGDPFAVYTVSLVHALAGEPKSAKHYAKSALKSGLAEHWFKIPALRTVWEAPDFQDALADRRKAALPGP